jgi:hypothetical protein
MKTELLEVKIRGKIGFLGGEKETRGWGMKSSTYWFTFFKG